jgi:very-short-patch-repair endonuclease
MDHDPVLYDRARQLRRDMTPAEVMLWKQVRDRRFAGFKFRRQQPLDFYIADFFCPTARLVVELDGDSHVGKEERDARRQRFIESQNMTVLRFWNVEVYDDLEMVLDTIWACLERARPDLVPRPDQPR